MLAGSLQSRTPSNSVINSAPPSTFCLSQPVWGLIRAWIAPHLASGNLSENTLRGSTGPSFATTYTGSTFPDDPNVRIFSLSATGTVRKEADPFLENLASLVESADRLSNRGKDVVLLL